jgi:hypothetical protein
MQVRFKEVRFRFGGDSNLNEPVHFFKRKLTASDVSVHVLAANPPTPCIEFASQSPRSRRDLIPQEVHIVTEVGYERGAGKGSSFQLIDQKPTNDFPMSLCSRMNCGPAYLPRRRRAFSSTVS